MKKDMITIVDTNYRTVGAVTFDDKVKDFLKKQQSYILSPILMRNDDGEMTLVGLSLVPELVPLVEVPFPIQPKPKEKE